MNSHLTLLKQFGSQTTCWIPVDWCSLLKSQCSTFALSWVIFCSVLTAFCVCRFKNSQCIAAEFGNRCKLANNNIYMLFGVVIQYSCWFRKFAQTMIDCHRVSQHVLPYLAIPVECKYGEARCGTNRRCIATEHLCDTENDCRDNSDEDPSFCSKLTWLMVHLFDFVKNDLQLYSRGHSLMVSIHSGIIVQRLIMLHAGLWQFVS